MASSGTLIRSSRAVAPERCLCIDGLNRRIVRLSPSGTRIGFLGPVFGLPYDVEATADGGAYVLEAGPVGWVRRVAANGTVTTVARKR